MERHSTASREGLAVEDDNPTSAELCHQESRQELDHHERKIDCPRKFEHGLQACECGRAVAISLLGVSAACAQEAQMQRQYVPRHKPAQQPSMACGDFNYSSLSIGPLDYRITPPDVRELVERRHFTRNVEQLKKGVTSTVGGDITYTLRAFPNHPRALKAAAELTRRNDGQKADWYAVFDSMLVRPGDRLSPG